MPSFTMNHGELRWASAALGRLHKPDPKLPAVAQDKRSLVLLEPDQWNGWLRGTEADARQMLAPPSSVRFDLAVTAQTDATLQSLQSTRELLINDRRCRG